MVRALHTLRSLPVRMVVTGAAAERVESLLPAGVLTTRNPDFAQGMGSSLSAGLRALPPGVDAALVMLVDLPDVTEEVVRRVLGAVEHARVRASLVRAVYDGVPGHPVLLGADHFGGILASATGDRGARDYLRAHPAVGVECSDLATGADRDTPDG